MLFGVNTYLKQKSIIKFNRTNFKNNIVFKMAKNNFIFFYGQFKLFKEESFKAARIVYYNDYPSYKTKQYY